MFQARILTLWTVMLAALVSNTALRSHAESDNHTAFTPSFATNDKTVTPPPLCTFEADIPSQCECVAALRLSDAVGSVGAGAVIGAVVFIARSGLNAFFCDEHVTFEDEDKGTADATVQLERLSLCLECPPAPKCTPTPEKKAFASSSASSPTVMLAISTGPSTRSNCAQTKSVATAPGPTMAGAKSLCVS